MASETLKRALMASAMEEYFDINKTCETNVWEPSEDFCQRMDSLLKQTQRKKISMKTVFLVAAVICLLSVTAVFSVAEIRDNVIGFFREYYYTHFVLEYGYEEAGDIPVAGGIETVFTLSDLPDGFQKVSETENAHSVITVWENADGDTLILSQGDGITTRNIDAERLSKTQLVSDGTVYEVYTDEGYILLLWNTEKYTFGIDHYGEMTAEELVGLSLGLAGVEE